MMPTGGTATTPAAAWAGGRFLLAVTILFAAQVGIIMVVGERPRNIVGQASEPSAFRAMAAPMNQTQISQAFFVADSTVFASATVNGFSGRAWLRFESVKYGPSEELEPSALLALDAHQIGTGLRLAEETNQVPFELAETRGPQAEPLPAFTMSSSARAQSVYHVEGPLAARQLGRVVAASSWPAGELLKNSVVQFAVNRSGEVVLQRLLNRSGLAEADVQAVAITRGLRFLPLPATNPPLTWSKAVFQWQTLEPTAK